MLKCGTPFLSNIEDSKSLQGLKKSLSKYLGDEGLLNKKKPHLCQEPHKIIMAVDCEHDTCHRHTVFISFLRHLGYGEWDAGQHGFMS